MIRSRQILYKAAIRYNSSQQGAKKNLFDQIKDRAQQFVPKGVPKNLVQDIKGSLDATKKNLIDDNATRYGGITSKEFRSRIKDMRLKGVAGYADNVVTVEENKDAGANIVMHKDSKWKQAWENMKDNNPIVSRIYDIKRTYEQSDNAFVNLTRNITYRLQDMFGSLTDENEHAVAIAEIKVSDPAFDVDTFVQDLREFVVPEVLEAFIDWDEKELKQYVTDGVMSVLKQSRDQLHQEGGVIEGRLLDLRNVELNMAKIIDDMPVLIVTFKAQQTEVVRDAKSNEIIAGDQNVVNDVYYAWALMRSNVEDAPLSNGWKIAEFSIVGVRESL
ncbi:hypothetical protein MIR68_011993 [Amoeboaphelidium protococcarum]|nr:hypothetical protein MIR68_011993 [Amoeboaphelidium protococcarum]